MKTIQKNGSTINVYLSNKLFKKLKEAIEERQRMGEEPKLQLPQAAYLVNLITYLPYKYRGDKYQDKFEDGWVPICSEIHKNILHFSKYMEFLEDEKLIERTSYSKDHKKCRRYRLTKPYRDLIVRRIDIPAHKNFVKKRQEEIQARMHKADISVPHLTRWLTPPNFQFNVEGALKYIREEYKLQNKKKAKGQKRHRTMTVESFKHGDWRYSREGEDNRLHSLLTTLPTDLRGFLKYQNSALCSLDIKNSQPYVFCSLLYNTLRGIHYEENNEITNRDIYRYYTTIMFDKVDKARLYGNLQRFIKEVVDGVFYENYGQYLFEQSLLMTNRGGKFFYYKQGEKGFRLEEYSELRKAAKDVLFQTLFGTHNFEHGTPRYIELFKRRYPEVFEIMQIIKKHKPKQKNLFPTMLQKIEADFMLDYATKLISQKYPEIPLLTIHDSIVTNEEYIGIVEHELKIHLENYFGIMPELKVEHWCSDCEEAA